MQQKQTKLHNMTYPYSDTDNEDVPDIRSNIARHLRRKLELRGTTLAEFSQEFDIPLTSLKSYLNGSANPRADTIELLAAKLGISPWELISDVSEPMRSAAAVCAIASDFSSMSRERQERLLVLFMELMEFFNESAI